MRLNKGKRLFNVFSKMLILLMIITPLLDPSLKLIAQTQNNCEQDIKEAETLYTLGRFDEAIEILERCKKSPGLTKEQETKIYRQLSYVYLAKEIETNAKREIERLLELVPNYKPDPVKDTPEYIKLVELVSTEKQAQQAQQPEPVEEKKGGSKKWLLIGGGVVVVAGVAALLLIDNPPPPPDDLGNFPNPPARP
jgi:tetratricopeptide (TPR) repeat protein